MRCSRCQHDNPSGTKFCGQCAAPLAATCSACGAANPSGNKFCGQCATPLGTAPDVSPSPESYTPKHLAEKILHAGMACLLAQRIEDATSRAQELLKLARRLGARAHEAHALCLAGDLASLHDTEHAAGYYRDALARADALGMRPLVAHCHLGLGKLFGRLGERAQAQEHLATAATMYGEMDMRFWLEQAEAESRKGE